jgi:sodium transport system permease protein
MNWKDIGTLYLRELRSALRERGIVVYSIIVPVVLYPLLVWLVYTAFSYASGQTAESRSRIMLRNLPVTHLTLYRAMRADPSIDLRFSQAPEDDLRKGELDLIIDFVQVQDAPPIAEGNVGARMTYDASRDASATARARAKRVIDRYRDQFISREADRLGISASQLQGFRVEEVNASTNAEMGRFVLGLLLPVMLVIMLAIGAIYPAIDTTAGERENGTWETMMTTATSRQNILIAKYLYVATMSFVAGSLNVVAMMFTMRSNLVLLGGPSGLTFQVPLSSLPVMLAGAALLALFIAAGMLIIASFARTFKEGQSLVSPFIIAFVLPLIFIQNPSQEFTTKIAFIPVVNVAMMFRQAIIGSFDWRPMVITLVIEFVFVALALKLATMIVDRDGFMLEGPRTSIRQFMRHPWRRRHNDGGGPIAG